MDELVGSMRRVKPTPSAAVFRRNSILQLQEKRLSRVKSWNTLLPTSLFLRYFLLLQGLTLGLCDCSVNLPRRISDRVVIPLADAESLHVVWQNGDTIWSQKIDRDRCTNSGEAQVINRSESLAFPENGLSAAITAMQPGGRQLAVAWKDGNQLFLKLGDSSPATQSPVVILDFFTGPTFISVTFHVFFLTLSLVSTLNLSFLTLRCKSFYHSFCQPCMIFSNLAHFLFNLCSLCLTLVVFPQTWEGLFSNLGGFLFQPEAIRGVVQFSFLSP